MKLLIVSATLLEVKPLLDRSELIQVIHPPFLYQYQLKNQYDEVNVPINFYLLHTSPGLMPTAYHLGNTFGKIEFDWVINAGICGSFNLQMPLGSILHITEEEVGDWGAEDEANGFIPIKTMDFFNSDSFPFQKGKLINDDLQLQHPLIQSLTKVKGISVNKVSGKQVEITKLKEIFEADVESMESAAVFYACLCEQKPFACIRSVSNYVESRNKESWDMPLAVAKLNDVLFEILAFS